MGSYYCHDCGRSLTTKGMMYHNASHSISNKSGNAMTYKQKRRMNAKNFNPKSIGQQRINWRKGNRKRQVRELVPKNKWSYYYNKGWRAGKKFLRNGYAYRYFYKKDNSKAQSQRARTSNIRRARNQYKRDKKTKYRRQGSNQTSDWYRQHGTYHIN